jgi:uncharacterized protein YjdB
MTTKTYARLGALVALTTLSACMMPMATNLSGNNVGLAGQPNAQGGSSAPTAGGPSTNTNNNKVVKEVQVTPGSFVVTKGVARKVTANVIYTDGTRDSNVTLASSDDTILSVNNTTGTISGLKEGITTIEAISTVDNTKKATATVTVKSGEVTEAVATIDPAEAEITVGGSTTLDASLKNSDGSTSSDISWSSSDTSIAVVSGTGGSATVVGKAPGTVTITAQGTDSTVKAKATITVVAK